MVVTKKTSVLNNALVKQVVKLPPIDERLAVAEIALERKIKENSLLRSKVKRQMLLNDNVLSSVQEYIKKIPERNLKPFTFSDKSRSCKLTPVSQLSDLHMGQEFKSEHVGGVNEFNPKILENSIKNYFIGLRIRNDFYRNKGKIDDCVIHLGGDMIHGEIHDLYLRTNSFGIAQQVKAMQECLQRGLETLLDDSHMQRIQIVCNVGNHGRMTENNIDTCTIETNHESYIYWHLMNTFKDETRIKFHFPDAIHAYLNIYGRNVLFTHGHFLKVSNIQTAEPIIERYLDALGNNEERYIDFGFMGHLHHHKLYDRFCINGSAPGYDSFHKAFLKVRKQMPQQTYVLVSNKFGFDCLQTDPIPLRTTS